MIFRVLILLFLSGELFASEADCPARALYVRNSLRELWVSVEPYPSSRARDGLFTTWDYSKPYYEVLKRSSRRVDRTKGVYQELEDRWVYSYREAKRYPWGSSRISDLLERTMSEFISLSYCYVRN